MLLLIITFSRGDYGVEIPCGSDFLTLFATMKHEGNQLLRAPSDMGRRDPMRVDEGRKGSIPLAMKTKARTVEGRGGRRACLVTPLDLSYVLGGRRREKKRKI